MDLISLRKLAESVLHFFEEKQENDEGILEQEIASVAPAARRALEKAPSLLGQDKGHGAAQHLKASLTEAYQTAPDLAQALAECGHDLFWRYGYQPRKDFPGLEQNMAWAELIGPKAYWQSDEICLGLTLIGPSWFYPPHDHPAIELYRVVSGRSEWNLEGKERLCFPKDRIFHPSESVHAMRAFQTPLLAVYSWRGDIVTASRYHTDSSKGTEN